MILSITIFSETMRFSSGISTCDDENQAKRQRKSGIKQPGCLQAQHPANLRETLNKVNEHYPGWRACNTSKPGKYLILGGSRTIWDSDTESCVDT